MSCILTSDDHDFIRYDSFVDYSRSRIEKSKSLMNGVKQGIFEARGSVDDAVLERIIKGLLSSSRTPYKVKEFYKKNS